MKDYFKFNLTGKQLLPIWLAYLLLYLYPYLFIQFELQELQKQHLGQQALQTLKPMLHLYGYMLLLLTVRYAIGFYIARMAINSIEFKEKSFVFIGQFGQFLWLIIYGSFLSIITIGIYAPWFIKKLYDFYINNTSTNGIDFEFKGQAKKLFKIITLTLISPMFLIMGILVSSSIMRKHYEGVSSSVYNLVSIFMVATIFIIMIPYIYYVYKWTVNIKYKDYIIQWKTSFWKSCGKIGLEILLSVVTVGIYFPLACLKLYHYFAQNTVAISDNYEKRFGYNIESKEDFLFIWGQILLTIITFGVYFSWAFCNVSERIMGKTFTENVQITK